MSEKSKKITEIMELHSIQDLQYKDFLAHKKPSKNFGGLLLFGYGVVTGLLVALLIIYMVF